MGGDLSKAEFEERCFRFSVRCDRETNARIEKAARHAGLTVTSFVQKHFESILDEPADDSGFSPRAFARRHNISEHAARLWRAMNDSADASGEITGASRAFGELAKIGKGRASDCLAELIGAGMVHVLQRPRPAQAGTYRIMGAS